MKERPIIMQPDSVRAILAGLKTQTRRVITPQPLEIQPTVDGQPFGWFDWAGHEGRPLRCPYGQPGDRLWVRETWQVAPMPDHGHPWAYRATEPSFATAWRPSIFMPRVASRLTLELTAVRVERLQDISEADALAEGVWRPGPAADPDAVDKGYDARFAYRSVWDDINGKKHPWVNSDWVWVLSFRRIEL